MFQLPDDMSAQHSLLSSLDTQLLDEAQHACEGAEEAITLEELHSALKVSVSVGALPSEDGHLPCNQKGSQGLSSWQNLAQMACHMSSSLGLGVYLVQSCLQSYNPSRLSLPLACQPP